MAKRLGNVFEETSDDAPSVASKIFNLSVQADKTTERMQSLAIAAINFDPEQPRREIPARVRAQWDGNTTSVGDLLRHWEELAQGEYPALAVKQLLQSGGEGMEIDEDQSPIAGGLLALISLAASIKRDGLANPISVYEIRDGLYEIETGERRCLAHHLLLTYTGDDVWSKIKCRIVNKKSVWRQAAENGARKDLNAIERARQLALLLMDMYSHDETFEPIEQIVLPGECDRKFYAQVAKHPVKRGFGQQVLDVMGLRSKAHLSLYRNLLEIPDALWVQADAENWTERRIREIRQQNQGERRSTMVDLPGEESESLQNSTPLHEERNPVQRETTTPVLTALDEDEGELITPPSEIKPSVGENEEPSIRMNTGGDDKPITDKYPHVKAFLRLIYEFGKDAETRAAAYTMLAWTPDAIGKFVQTYGIKSLQEQLEREWGSLSVWERKIDIHRLEQSLTKFWQACLAVGEQVQ